MKHPLDALSVGLSAYDTAADEQCGPHPEFEQMEQIKIAFDDTANNFNGIDSELVLWAMVRTARDFIKNHRLLPF